MKIAHRHQPFFRAAQTLGAASRDPEAIGNPVSLRLGMDIDVIPTVTNHMDQMVLRCLPIYRFQLLLFKTFISHWSHWTSGKVFSDRGNDSTHDVSDVVQT